MYSVYSGARLTSHSLPLLVLLFLLGTSCSANHLQAPPPTDSVLQELASHLGVDAATLQQPQAAWDSSSLSIHRRLEGKGFHKTLHLHLQAAAAAPPQGSQGCHLSLLQPLPSSIFADPYQLEDLTRPSGSGSTRKAGFAYTFKLLGPLDLELPAPACEDTALLLHLNTTWQQLQQQQDVGAGPAAVLVPLHAKYPQPYAAGNPQGWHWTLTGHAAAVLPWPYLLLDCRQQGGSLALMPPPAALQQEQQCTCSSTDPTCSASSEADSSSSSGAIGSSRESCGDDGLLWLVPTGNLDHQVLVSWGTLLVTAACCLAVSWTALSSARGQP